jgi:hypothetical protein
MNNDIVARLRSNGGLDARLLCAAADEIERLRAERDEARREICDWISEGREDPKVIAQRYRWDCFKENGK